MTRPCAVHLLTADVVVQSDSAVLLVMPQHAPDGADGWRLPGDELRWGEQPEACVRRVLKEQVGLEPEDVVLAEVESSTDARWRLAFHYRCEADRQPRPGDGVREARFFQIEHLPATAHGTWERDAIYRVVAAGASG